MFETNTGRHSLLKRISLLVCMVIIFSLAFANVSIASELKLVAPTKNAQGQYEISKPEHLMYMSKNYGKNDVPRDGHYILTADIDMAGVTGYVPMGKNKENTFLGVLDGQNHVIKNLTIGYGGKKYVALFGYLGNDDVLATVKNLGMVNVDITGTQNVAGIAGVSYGTILNCFVTGKLTDDEGSNANSVGGIVGKNKEGEGLIVGLIKDSYAVVDIKGSYNLGGIAGQEDGGGIIENCYAAGTIFANSPNGAAGGLVGAFNAGQKVVNNASLVSKITGEKDIDKIVGQLFDESGNQITGNIAWDAMAIIGNGPVEQPIKWTDKSSKELSTKSTYTNMGWDFEKIWAFKGTDGSGYPILKAFSEKDQEYKFDWSIDTSIVSSPVKEVKSNVDIEISARVISSSEPASVEIFYGDIEDGSTFTKKASMQKVSGDTYTGKIPGVLKGNIYYYIKVTTKSGVVTKPYYIKNSIKTYVDDGTIFGEPREVVISLGEVQSTMNFNWITVPKIKDSVVQYAKKDGFNGKYIEVLGTSSIIAVTAGFNEKMSHKVTVEGLEPNTTYVYRVGNGKNFMSPQYEFKSPPAASDTKEFTFIFASDPQSVSKEDYESLKFVYDYALTQVPNPAFTIMAGDITQDGYKASQWECFFDSVSNRLTSIPFMPAIGNHEIKGDSKHLTFKSRFNTPANGPGDDLRGTVYSFEYGDAFFATLNTEVTPSAELAISINKQLDWLQGQLKKTDKKWKIVQLHQGPYSSNHDPSFIRSLLIKRLDEMKIDLVLSGHDHLYLRTTMKDDQKVALGEGATYVTGGTVGIKYYEYLDRADRWTEVYADEFDRQIVNFVTVSKDKIALKAMQRVDPKSKEFKQLDYFEITNTLTEGKKPGPAPAAIPSKTIHLVKPGEYLLVIALKYGVTWQELAQINNLANPNLIFPGQKIVIPAK